MAAARKLRLSLPLAALLSPWLATGALASTIELSTLSSDDTPASVLDATIVFMITGPSELTVSVTNDTAAPDAYNINGVWFNAAPHVNGLTLVSATHSDAGDVFAAWNPVEPNSNADGFGSFVFALTNGVGENDPSVIGPGEMVDFVLSISGVGPYDMSDFVYPNSLGIPGAAKFVNGPAENDPFETAEDSAFGAVPEPASAALLAAGLLGMALAGRRRSR